VRAARACYDVAKAYGTPFISGKDSLNNEFQADGVTVVIPGTLLVSAMSVMEDVTRAVTMDLKKAGNFLYAVGTTRDELGGSQFYAIHRKIGKNVPIVDTAAGKACFEALSAAVRAGLVASCHDVSDGGFAVTVSEMAFAGGLGVDVALEAVPTKGRLLPRAVLFSESASRFVVEVEQRAAKDFEEAMRNVPCARVGAVTGGETVTMTVDGEPVVKARIDDLKAAWKAPLAF
jgi:phosphoribosylformylglycinamidine synthase